MENLDKDYIHEWFELSYAQYVALPRSVLQSMPVEWQERFVKLMDELDQEFEWRREGCEVKFIDKSGNLMEDELADYDEGSRMLNPTEVKSLTEKHNNLYDSVSHSEAD